MTPGAEKCIAIVAMAAIAIAGMYITKSADLASMAIGAIAGLAGTGIASGVSRAMADAKIKQEVR